MINWILCRFDDLLSYVPYMIGALLMVFLLGQDASLIKSFMDKNPPTGNYMIVTQSSGLPELHKTHSFKIVDDVISFETVDGEQVWCSSPWKVYEVNDQ